MNLDQAQASPDDSFPRLETLTIGSPDTDGLKSCTAFFRALKHVVTSVKKISSLTVRRTRIHRVTRTFRNDRDIARTFVDSAI